jgi:NADH:ubiquinone oxidoreductase subunit K
LAERLEPTVNLRSFHLLFIAVATLLAAFLAFWTINRYLAGGALEYAVIACLSIAAAVGLAVYAAAFRRRSRYW